MPNRWGFKLFSSSADKAASSVAEKKMSKVDSQRRLSSAYQLMTDRPDGVADISDCALTSLPRDFFDLCQTYVKTDIIAAENRLRDIEPVGGEMGILRRIRKLDLQRNCLERLPVKFGEHFPSLVVLNLSDNCLKALPNSLGMLRQLKVLIVARNKLTEFPAMIKQSMPLEELDISGNGISVLPEELGRVGTLRVLTVDAVIMVYPSRDVCEKGTVAILERLRKDMVVESEDSGCLSGGEADLKPARVSAVAETVQRYVNEDEKMRETIKRYSNDEGLQRNELRRFHAAMDEDHLRHAASIYRGKRTEQQSLIRMLEEQNKAEAYLHTLTMSVEKGKKSLDEALVEMETHSQRLLAQLTALSNERTKHFRSYEDDLRKEDLAWRNLHIQLEVSKREEILSAMKQQLEDTEKSDAFYKHLMSIAKLQVDYVVQHHRDEERRYIPLVGKTKAEQDNIINSLLQDESVQQEMFRSLQLKTDSVHQRIMRDMVMLENELAALSLLEQKQRDEQTVTAKNSLEDERIKLAKLYHNLVQEKQAREVQLRALLHDMQREAVKHEENFWLVQYSRLMEALPPGLRDFSSPANQSERKILEKVFQKKPATATPSVAAVDGGPVPAVLHMEATCIICMDRLSTSVFLPCGHVVCCWLCGEQVEECPLCRATISRKLTLSQSVGDDGSGDAGGGTANGF
ncbi:putative E3 ubiquitin-protein ligase LRSAM1 [Hypsibius exemplaris]|uniref:E3 ubiquitin-protein ligase LRSAM1 n=1 Tax=Hypsibius exemplaris TaxID=2072580 RepID=A0A1W0X177_HYPEX|nr:putative E3 ubiquitin-protein ligase LRSAM1 [Hypsibius exemplaris]